MHVIWHSIESIERTFKGTRTFNSVWEKQERPINVKVESVFFLIFFFPLPPLSRLFSFPYLTWKNSSMYVKGAHVFQALNVLPRLSTSTFLLLVQLFESHKWSEHESLQLVCLSACLFSHR